MPMEGRGTVARWDPDTGRLTVWTSTQTSTGVRAAVAAKLGLDLGSGRRGHARRRWRLRRQDQPPLAGGAVGAARGPHPRPGREVHRGPARALHLVRARARADPPRRRGVRRRGAHPRARRALLARQRRLHAVRADRADHHLHPAARSLQAGCLPGDLRLPLHEHGDGHAVPRGRAPAGLLRDGADHGCDRRGARQGAHRGQVGELHPAGRVPLRPRPDLPGRSRVRVRLRRLPGVPAEAQGPDRVGRVPGVPRGDGARGTAGRDRSRLLRRGHRRRPLRGRSRTHRDVGQGQGRDRAHHAGAGARDRVRPDRRRRARRAVRAGRGRHRRHPADAVRRRHVRVPGGGDERIRRTPGGAAGPGEGAADRRRRARGGARTTSRSSTAWCR